ncbi:hypothetical protein [Henriciella aquimarina]|uniref:hypothetical protein n=1 Tax=Henriciella aquimarina TaxID=545261 RepID=UPI00117A2958|nr:hypothetical protein [Henriciella aquimarina]
MSASLSVTIVLASMLILWREGLLWCSASFACIVPQQEELKRMGWDNDKSGDYVPKPPPLIFWVLVVLVIGAFVAAAIADG